MTDRDRVTAAITEQGRADYDAYRATASRLRTVCAWCGEVLDGLGPVGDGPISHGICPECAEEKRSELAEMRAEMNRHRGEDGC